MTTLPTRAMREQALRRCRAIAQELADVINRSPLTPHADDGPPSLRGAYYADDGGEGGAMLRCRVDYWHFVEFGTRYMAAQPHVRPAVEYVRARNT